jgi:hypothetical protein
VRVFAGAEGRASAAADLDDRLTLDCLRTDDSSERILMFTAPLFLPSSILISVCGFP